MAAGIAGYHLRSAAVLLQVVSAGTAVAAGNPAVGDDRVVATGTLPAGEEAAGTAGEEVVDRILGVAEIEPVDAAVAVQEDDHTAVAAGIAVLGKDDLEHTVAAPAAVGILEEVDQLRSLEVDAACLEIENEEVGVVDVVVAADIVEDSEVYVLLLPPYV